MPTIFHVLAGALALGTGYLALATAKGGPRHRRAGRWFVYTMLAMGLSGAAIAVVEDAAPLLNVPPGLLTAYLVVTGLTTVRPPSPATRRVNRAAMVAAVAGGAAGIAAGLVAMTTGRAGQGVMPVVFGAIALAAGLADRRLLRTGGLPGTARLRRHVWRMGTALLIAAMAFFFGQSDELPALLRRPPLLALPVVAVLVTMLAWLWRLRRSRTFPAGSRGGPHTWLTRRGLELDAEDFQAEIRVHLALAAADRVARGADPDAARFAALKDFGNVTLATEAARRVWRPRWLEALADVTTDLRHALRTLARRPAFSTTVVAVLATGIGVNAAVFTMLKSIALTPLSGVHRSSSLAVVFGETSSGRALRMSYPDYLHLRDHDRSFSGLFGSALAQVNLGRGRGARQVSAELVTGNYFQVLGVGAALGRTLLPSDEVAPGRHPVAVLSDGIWRRDFAADPAIVGKTIVVNARPLTVVGVADPAFHGTIVSYDVELFVPVLTAPELGYGFGSREPTPAGVLADPQAALFFPQGFLRPGVTGDRAAAELGALWDARRQARPIDTPDQRLRVVPFSQSPGSGQTFILPTLMALGGMGLLVLLIACTNIAGLVLVRGLSRRGEIAVRLALGAARRRIVRLLVIENLALAVPGALLGLLLSWRGIPWLMGYAEWLATPQRLHFNLEVDAMVVGFAALAAVASVLVFGLVPAVQSTRIDLVTVINADATPRSAARGRARAALVVAQVGVSVLLLIGAGLAMRSVDAARRIDTGFDREGVALVQLHLGQHGFDAARGLAFYRSLLASARTAPAIESATLAEHTPLGLLDTRARRAVLEGVDPRRGEDLAFLSNAVGPDYFRTLRIGVVAGRRLDDHDDDSAPPVVVVNRTLAERFFGSAGGAIGRRLRLGDDTWRTIVGVAADVKYARVDEAPRPYVYLPFLQAYRPLMVLHVRGPGAVDGLVERARGLVAALDPELPVLKASALAHEIRGAFIFLDLMATMLGIFGLAGMALAALGTYGLVSYGVTQSTHEIGLRMALGASRTAVARAFLARGLRLGVGGALLGAAAAAATTRLLAGLLVGVSPTDAATFAAALAVVLSSVILATLLPAWRASRVNPLRALRHD